MNETRCKTCGCLAANHSTMAPAPCQVCSCTAYRQREAPLRAWRWRLEREVIKP
jgi:hypothetical protein